MTSRTTPALSLFVVVATATSASAQLSVPWFTIDGGGGTSTGGTFTLSGTIGQHDAAQASSGGSFSLTGGFWPGLTTRTPPPCSADFNLDGVINPDDLADYISTFFAQPPDLSADFNGDGIVNPDDLADFVTAFFAGCP